jgi:hypothetical protein
VRRSVVLLTLVSISATLPAAAPAAQVSTSCKMASALLLRRNAAAARTTQQLLHDTSYTPIVRMFKPRPTSTKGFTGHQTIVVRAPAGTSPVAGYFALRGAEPCSVIVTSAQVVLRRGAYVVTLKYPGEQGSAGRLTVTLVSR